MSCGEVSRGDVSCQDEPARCVTDKITGQSKYTAAAAAAALPTRSLNANLHLLPFEWPLFPTF